MLHPPEIVKVPPQSTAVVHLTIPRSEIRTVMMPAIREVMDAVAAQGMVPGGPVFSHHFKMDPDTFDFEVGVPLEKQVATRGRVEPGQLPAATVARAIYQGGYEGLGEAWMELDRWIAANGHKPGIDLWECYVAGPETGPDPATWRTELNRPLILTVAALG